MRLSYIIHEAAIQIDGFGGKCKQILDSDVTENMDMHPHLLFYDIFLNLAEPICNVVGYTIETITKPIYYSENLIFGKKEKTWLY